MLEWGILRVFWFVYSTLAPITHQPWTLLALITDHLETLQMSCTSCDRSHDLYVTVQSDELNSRILRRSQRNHSLDMTSSYFQGQSHCEEETLYNDTPFLFWPNSSHHSTCLPSNTKRNINDIEGTWGHHAQEELTLQLHINIHRQYTTTTYITYCTCNIHLYIYNTFFF